MKRKLLEIWIIATSLLISSTAFASWDERLAELPEVVQEIPNTPGLPHQYHEIFNWSMNRLVNCNGRLPADCIAAEQATLFKNLFYYSDVVSGQYTVTADGWQFLDADVAVGEEISISEDEKQELQCIESSKGEETLNYSTCADYYSSCEENINNCGNLNLDPERENISSINIGTSEETLLWTAGKHSFDGVCEEIDQVDWIECIEYEWVCEDVYQGDDENGNPIYMEDCYENQDSCMNSVTHMKTVAYGTSANEKTCYLRKWVKDPNSGHTVYILQAPENWYDDGTNPTQELTWWKAQFEQHQSYVESTYGWPLTVGEIMTAVM